MISTSYPPTLIRRQVLFIYNYKTILIDDSCKGRVVYNCMQVCIRRLSDSTTVIKAIRKKKSLYTKQDEKKITNKEKIRRMIEHNERTTPRSFDRQVTDLMDRASDRFQFVKNKFFQIWNPDYGKEFSSNGIRLDSWKPKLVMDRRWWFWNIVMALTPAVLISIYCEFRVKPLMAKHGAEIEKKQMLDLMGPEFVSEFDMHRQKQLENNSTSVSDNLEYLMNITRELPKHIRELIEFLSHAWSGENIPDIGSVSKSEQDMTSIPVPVEQKSETVAAPLETTKDTKVTTDVLNRLDKESIKITASDINLNDNNSTKNSDGTEQTKMQELIDRIQRLETIILSAPMKKRSAINDQPVATKNIGNLPSDSIFPDTQSNTAVIKGKSGIQQRMEVDAVARYRKQLEELKIQNAAAETATTTTPTSKNTEQEYSVSKVLSTVMTITSDAIRDGLTSIIGSVGWNNIDNNTGSIDVQNSETQRTSPTPQCTSSPLVTQKTPSDGKAMSHVVPELPSTASESSTTSSQSKEESSNELKDSVSETIPVPPWYKRLVKLEFKKDS